MSKLKWPPADTRLYRDLALDPANWISRAEDLLEVAALVECSARQQLEHISNGNVVGRDFYSKGPLPTYIMLVSFAIENLLKAILIRRDSTQFLTLLEQGTFPKTLQTHDIFALMTAVGIAPTDRITEIFIRRLTRAATWHGRYPVPVDFKQLENVRYSDGQWAGTEFASDKDIEVLGAIVALVKEQLAENPV